MQPDDGISDLLIDSVVEFVNSRLEPHNVAWQTPGQSMTDNDEIRAAIWKLHPVERMSTLLMTIIQCNSRDTMKCISGFLAMITAMAAVCGTESRVKFVGMLRDCADEIERPHL